MRVLWTELALSQLEEAMAYIARDRPATAARWLDKLLATAESLAELPERGRMVAEAQREDVRELIVRP